MDFQEAGRKVPDRWRDVNSVERAPRSTEKVQAIENWVPLLPADFLKDTTNADRLEEFIELNRDNPRWQQPVDGDKTIAEYLGEHRSDKPLKYYVDDEEGTKEKIIESPNLSIYDFRLKLTEAAKIEYDHSQELRSKNLRMQYRLVDKALKIKKKLQQLPALASGLFRNIPKETRSNSRSYYRNRPERSSLSWKDALKVNFQTRPTILMLRAIKAILKLFIK